jgi:2-phosphosulfolactate phosphatase
VVGCVVIFVDLEFSARDAGKAVARRDLIVAIDALRSGTSILNALVNGAKAFVPVESLKEAHRIHRQHPNWLLAGERGGKKPRGFDLGNSPLEYTLEKVDGKTFVLTTTSGTAALTRSLETKWVLVGTFLNALAVADRAQEIAWREKIDVSFVLAGENGRFSLEDFLCSGAISDGFNQRSVQFSDKVQAGLLSFKQARNDLKREIMQAEHARHLVKLGFKDFASRLNVSRAVPFYKAGRITLQE